MPDYVKKAPERLQRPKPKLPQYTSHLWTVPSYGKILHMEPAPYESDLFYNEITKLIQSIVSTFLYYS